MLSVSSLFINIIFFSFLLNFCTACSDNEEFCEKIEGFREDGIECKSQQSFSRKRYILYDVNPPEGFNLRRDVYVRAAVFVKALVDADKEFEWYLVLPPWGNLFHWRTRNLGPQKQLSWGLFFDIASFQKYIPVLEMYQFLQHYPSKHRKTSLDIVYILQNDDKMFESGKFEDKNEVVDCNTDAIHYHQSGENQYTGYFWGYSNITSADVKCITFHGLMSNLRENLQPEQYRSVMFDHMEIPLHDQYGSQEYWRARRSMRYNSDLYLIAKKFRQKYLNSTDEEDKTERPGDWTNEKARRDAVGGPYLAVHLRRRDFVVGRTSYVPTLKDAAYQIRKKLNELGLIVLFLATDAEQQEFDELKSFLSEFRVLKYTPSANILKQFKDGGVAIIDQIICSYARYFIGTHESTFTFRIQEDREIIGFPPLTTFNRLCKTTKGCSRSGSWEIIW